MTHKPRHSGGVPGASGPPGRNYPVSKPSPAPPGEKGGGGYVAPSQPKQSVKSLMTSDKAYKVDTHKKETKTVDDSSREKGIMRYATTGLKELGEKRLSDALRYKAGERVTRFDKEGDEEEVLLSSSEFKKRNLQQSLDAAWKRLNKKITKEPTPKEKERISYSRALMSKMGVPLQTRNYLYDLFVGTELGGTKRRDSYKPLTISDFNEADLKKLKAGVLDALFQEHGSLKINTQINLPAWGEWETSPDDLYHTLGDVTAHINEAGEVIVNDFTDYFGEYSITTVDDKGKTVETSINSYSDWIKHTVKGASQILDGTLEMDNIYSIGRVNDTLEEKKDVSISDKVKSLSNFLVYDVAKALASIEGTQESDYPSKVSELKKVAPTGVTELNLGKVGE